MGLTRYERQARERAEAEASMERELAAADMWVTLHRLYGDAGERYERAMRAFGVSERESRAGAAIGRIRLDHIMRGGE